MRHPLRTHSSLPQAAPARYLCLGLVVLALSRTISVAAAQDVYLNEYRKSLAGPTDVVEIYNAGPGSADISGWLVVVDDGPPFIVPEATILPEGAYFALEIGDEVNPIGGQIELIDDVDSASGFALADRVRFGIAGGAPAPPLLANASLARVPDAAAGPPLAPFDDENWWTVDLTPTFGNPNDAQPSNLGAGPVINEIRVGEGANPDSIEVYNPLPVQADLFGWFVSSAENLSTLNGIVPAGGVAAFEIAGINLGATLRADLFDDQTGRWDQKGIAGAPRASCFGSCPDGAAPSNGFDYPTSGGDVDWFAVECTLGSPNEIVLGAGCDVSGTGNPDGGSGPSVNEVGWGVLKRQFR